MGDHYYETSDGERLPGVTTVLRASGLSYYPAAVTRAILDAKARLGEKVHLITEALDRGQIDSWGAKEEAEAFDDPRCVGFVDSYLNFRNDLPALDYVAIEEALISAEYGYGGTIDRVWTQHGLIGVMDIKCLAAPIPSGTLQTAGYARLLGDDLVPRQCLYLLGDGRYKLQAHNDPQDINVFLAALLTYRWKETHGIPVA